MDKETLLNRKASKGTSTVTLDKDVVVVVRALTRGEVQAIRKGKPDEDVYERRIIAAGLVDPEMTYEEVTLWLSGDPNDPDDDGAPAGDSVKVTTAIAELSGLTEQGAQKSVPGVRRRPRR
jgi:hypothetical protein